MDPSPSIDRVVEVAVLTLLPRDGPGPFHRRVNPAAIAATGGATSASAMPCTAVTAGEIGTPGWFRIETAALNSSHRGAAK